jgi:exodeoxyribonuclease III
VRIGTWNVNGLRKRLAEVTAWVESERLDVVCLQEIKATPDQIEPLTTLPEFSSYWHGLKGGYSGVSVHVRKESFPAAVTFSNPAFDTEARVVEARTGPWCFASAYFPNGGKDFPAKMEFLAAMEGHVGEILRSGARLVLCGDLNVAREDRDVYPNQRKPGIIGCRPDERALFERMIAHGLVDVGRAREPDNDQLFTWWPYWRNLRQKNQGWRIDYVLTTPEVFATVTDCRVLREYGSSDHGPLVLDLEGEKVAT